VVWDGGWQRQIRVMNRKTNIKYGWRKRDRETKGQRNRNRETQRHRDRETWKQGDRETKRQRD
jgi:hypothetical protein